MAVPRPYFSSPLQLALCLTAVAKPPQIVLLRVSSGGGGSGDCNGVDDSKFLRYKFALTLQQCQRSKAQQRALSRRVVWS